MKRKNACTRTPLENRWMNRVMNERCVGGCDVDVYVTPEMYLMIRRTVTLRAPKTLPPDAILVGRYGLGFSGEAFLDDVAETLRLVRAV